MKRASVIMAILTLAVLLSHCSSPADQGNSEENARREISLNGIVVTSRDTINDAVITCTGDIVVEEGGHLTLDNVLLCMCDSIHGIYVEPGGELVIQRGSRVTAKNPAIDHYEFWFKDGSLGRIENSSVEYTWTPDPDGKSQFSEAGLFIEAEHFIVRNSTITHSLGNGMEAFHADSLTIENSSFTENGANGLLIRNSTNFSIKGTDFSNNGTVTQRVDGCGLVVLVADGSIDSCNVASNRYTGIEGSGGMETSISNCTVQNNGHFGIFVHDEFSSSTVEIFGNTILSNADSSNFCAGISIEGAVDCHIHDNILRENFIGIRVLNNTGTCRIDSNTITGCPAYGLHIDNASPVFHRNTISGCSRAAFIQDMNGAPHPNFGDATLPNTGYNDFSGNDGGIRNDSSVSTIKAENNYWGYTEWGAIESYNFTDDTQIDFTPWLDQAP